MSSDILDQKQKQGPSISLIDDVTKAYNAFNEPVQLLEQETYMEYYQKLGEFRSVNVAYNILAVIDDACAANPSDDLWYLNSLKTSVDIVKATLYTATLPRDKIDSPRAPQRMAEYVLSEMQNWMCRNEDAFLTDGLEPLKAYHTHCSSWAMAFLSETILLIRILCKVEIFLTQRVKELKLLPESETTKIDKENQKETEECMEGYEEEKRTVIDNIYRMEENYQRALQKYDSQLKEYISTGYPDGQAPEVWRFHSSYKNVLLGEEQNPEEKSVVLGTESPIHVFSTRCGEDMMLKDGRDEFEVTVTMTEQMSTSRGVGIVSEPNPGFLHPKICRRSKTALPNITGYNHKTTLQDPKHYIKDKDLIFTGIKIPVRTSPAFGNYQDEYHSESKINDTMIEEHTLDGGNDKADTELDVPAKDSGTTIVSQIAGEEVTDIDSPKSPKLNIEVESYCGSEGNVSDGQPTTENNELLKEAEPEQTIEELNKHTFDRGNDKADTELTALEKDSGTAMVSQIADEKVTSIDGPESQKLNIEVESDCSSEGNKSDGQQATEDNTLLKETELEQAIEKLNKHTFDGRNDKADTERDVLARDSGITMVSQIANEEVIGIDSQKSPKLNTEVESYCGSEGNVSDGQPATENNKILKEAEFDQMIEELNELSRSSKAIHTEPIVISGQEESATDSTETEVTVEDHIEHRKDPFYLAVGVVIFIYCGYTVLKENGYQILGLLRNEYVYKFPRGPIGPSDLYAFIIEGIVFGFLFWLPLVMYGGI
jgi:hypothetical protein